MEECELVVSIVVRRGRWDTLSSDELTFAVPQVEALQYVNNASVIKYVQERVIAKAIDRVEEERAEEEAEEQRRAEAESALNALIKEEPEDAET